MSYQHCNFQTEGQTHVLLIAKHKTSLSTWSCRTNDSSAETMVFHCVGNGPGLMFVSRPAHWPAQWPAPPSQGAARDQNYTLHHYVLKNVIIAGLRTFADISKYAEQNHQHLYRCAADAAVYL
jgi:hypothetical protein